MALSIHEAASRIVTAKSSLAAEDVRTGLRTALRRLAKAVVVVTCRAPNGRFAMTATAVSELCMDPPSLLVCVNHNASMYGALAHASHFGVNILHSSQRQIAENCAGLVKGEMRFSLGAWAEESGVPYLLGAQAHIVCRNEQRVDYGTHGVFFGVVRSVHSDGDVSPLVYMDGSYGRVSERV